MQQLFFLFNTGSFIQSILTLTEQISFISKQETCPLTSLFLIISFIYFSIDIIGLAIYIIKIEQYIRALIAVISKCKSYIF
jgi:hypothetical protein